MVRASLVVVALALASSGCFTYYVGSKSFDHQTSGGTEAILLSSEVAAGAAFGAIIYSVSNPRERLPLAGSIAVGVGLAFVADVLIGGIVALTGCIGNERCGQ